MKVLGIETSGNAGGVALFEEDRLLGERCIALQGAHTERLLPTLHGLLSEVGVRLAEVGAVAVSLGPGSFTGLRAGLGLAKGFAYALGLDLVGIPTLEVLAAGCEGSEWILSISDARRNEVFFAVYRNSDGVLVECLPTRLGSVEDLAPVVLEFLPQDRAGLSVVGNETYPLEAAEEALSDRGVGVVYVGRSLPRPGVVARLGAVRLGREMCDDPMTLEPLYVRPSDAEDRYPR